MRKVIRVSWFMAWANCIMNDQWTLPSEQCHSLTIMVHRKCKYNCFVCNEIQKPHLNNNVKVVIQTGKTLNSQLSWHDLILTFSMLSEQKWGWRKCVYETTGFADDIGKACLFLVDGRLKKIDIISSPLFWGHLIDFAVASVWLRGEPSYSAVDYGGGRRGCKNYSAATEPTVKEMVADAKNCWSVHPLSFV